MKKLKTVPRAKKATWMVRHMEAIKEICPEMLAPEKKLDLGLIIRFMRDT